MMQDGDLETLKEYHAIYHLSCVGRQLAAMGCLRGYFTDLYGVGCFADPDATHTTTDGGGGGGRGNYSPECVRFLYDEQLLRLTDLACSAASNGHLECLKTLCENGCPHDLYAVAGAARYGRLDCLKYLHARGATMDPNVALAAAQGGDLERLKYSYAHGATMDLDVALAAAQGGHLECLKYLKENGCRINFFVANCAAEHGHADCLQYLFAIGCEHDITVLDTVIKYGHSACVHVFLQTCPPAVRARALHQFVWAPLLYDQLECLRVFHALGAKLDSLPQILYFRPDASMDMLWYISDNATHSYCRSLMRDVGCFRERTCIVCPVRTPREYVGIPALLVHMINAYACEPCDD